MFSPDSEENSFEQQCSVGKVKNKRLEKRKWSYKNTSDEESSVNPNLSNSRRQSNGKNNLRSSKISRLSNGTVTSKSSVSHPAIIGSKSGFSASTPKNVATFTPPTGRRTLFGDDKCTDQDDTEINDDAEELRVERENQVSGQDSTLDGEKGSRSLEILAHFLDIDLSSEQLAAHLASCIELNAANKINVNNAFNLKLIDYMVVLLKRNDKTMKDFPTMSCGLDASTRIYACRVDNVHLGIMEIVTGLATADKKKKKSKDLNSSVDRQEGDNDDDDDDDEEISNRGRTKKRKAVLASSSKAVNRNCIEVANWMSRKAIEPNFTALFNLSRMTQSRGAGLSLLKDSVSLMPDKTSTQTSCEQSTVETEFPDSLSINSPLFSSSFKFEWDKKSNDKNCTSTISEIENEAMQTLEDKSVIVDRGICTDSQDITSDDDNFMTPDGPDLDFDEPVKPDVPDCNIDSVKIEEESKCSLKQNRRGKEHIDALSLVKSKLVLADGENDYSYMNTDVIPMLWAGPDHWKPIFKRGKPAVVAECAEKKPKKMKKKWSDGISFEDFSMLDSILSKKVNSSLQSKTVRKWSEKKVTLPVKTEYKVDNLYRSFLRKTLFWKPLVKPEKDDEEFKFETKYADDIEDVLEDNNFTTEQMSVLHELDDFVSDQESVHDNQSENGDIRDKIEILNEEVPLSSEPLMTDNLVPLPRMVQCGTITYATVPKRVNMKQLKETVWNLMDLEGDKENQSGNLLNGRSSDNAVKFSDLYLELPKHLPTDSRNDLSPALAFLSVLHLANEKMLRLTSLDKDLLTNFTIQKDLGCPVICHLQLNQSF
ncbi:non-SMC condensin I complex subunit H [Lycorma delicatula]|uniref:non-SMC condensin I complex subunit H n=1 Tax=Lycorma delicatula TaxID=130591 RepID=UPI003F518DB6